MSERPDLVERAREAASRRDWREAHRLFGEADALGVLQTADLPLVAQVAYAAGDLDLAIETWERAHAESLRAGDLLAAAGAAVRVALHLILDAALMAPVRGWVTRAERLLEGSPETPVHAWLAVVRADERLLAGDIDGARGWARQAIQVGTRVDPAAAAIGRVAEGRSLILAGEVREGLLLLDEAGVAATSGELDPLSTGVVYCELVCALQGLAQFDLAEEWTNVMERWCAANAIGTLHGRCRVHRAEILRLRGHLDDAEEQALLACEELRPYLRRELGWPLSELGRIRLRKGDLAGAEEALDAAHAAGWDPQPGLALVQLARGEVAQAASSIREALEQPSHVPSKEQPPDTDLRRAPLLEAEVEIALAAGDLDRARSARRELSEVAARFGSKALAAAAALAHGRVCLAEGGSAEARRHFEEASRLWAEVGAPFEAALARSGLAEARRAGAAPGPTASDVHPAHPAHPADPAPPAHPADPAPPAHRPMPDPADAADPAQPVHPAHPVHPADPARPVHAAHAAHAARPAEQVDVVDPRRRPTPTAVEGPTSSVAHPAVFRREGDYWVVAFDGRLVRLRDLKGMRYVARLLAAPQREFHVVDLVAGEEGAPGEPEPPADLSAEPGLTPEARGGGLGPLLDARAKAAYRRRLEDIDDDLEEARARGDSRRAGQAEAERDFLLAELASAVGLGGRDRRVGSASERARASVTRAVRQAVLRIGEHHPALQSHLDRTIRTGTYCAYDPDPRAPIAWEL